MRKRIMSDGSYLYRDEPITKPPLKRDEILGKKFKVLDHGYVMCVDVFGDDQAVVDAARVSYGEGTKKKTNTEGLIDYLMRHRHTSPFEMSVIKWEIKLPIFVARQWIRHRTVSVNEMSGRYSVLPTEFYTPEKESVQRQSKTNKQGRELELSDFIQEAFAENFINESKTICQEAFASYENALGIDIARELARIQLPLATYTKWVWQINLHNLFHFLKLRTAPDAQWEFQQYTKVMEGIVRTLFPLSHSSWRTHIRDAISIASDEWDILKPLMDEQTIKTLIDNSALSGTRKRELKIKLGIK
jgi:thymidylate synthase (FAD)